MATITVETTRVRAGTGSVLARSTARLRELAATWMTVMRDQDDRMRHVSRVPGGGVDEFMRAGGGPTV